MVQIASMGCAHRDARQHSFRVNAHRQLAVWTLSGELIQAAYAIVDRLPKQERFVAGQQLLRAAWSVQNNIAEGNAKRGKAERRRFFDVALGSLAEVDSIVGTLRTLYPDVDVDPERVETLRRRITAGMLGMVRRGRQ